MEEIQMCATCGHNILRGEDFVCEIGHDVPCAWVRQSVPHAAAVARVAELEGEVERLRGVVVESDKDLVANAARKIARDHNMPLKSAEWMMLEAIRVVRSNDNRERDAALARAEKAEKAEKERDEAVRVRNNAIVEAASLAVFREAAETTMIEQEQEVSAALARATAAEAREAGLRTDAAAVLLAINEARMLDAALVLRRMARAAAPAKGDKPCG